MANDESYEWQHSQRAHPQYYFDEAPTWTPNAIDPPALHHRTSKCSECVLMLTESDLLEANKGCIRCALSVVRSHKCEKIGDEPMIPVENLLGRRPEDRGIMQQASKRHRGLSTAYEIELRTLDGVLGIVKSDLPTTAAPWLPEWYSIPVKKLWVACVIPGKDQEPVKLCDHIILKPGHGSTKVVLQVYKRKPEYHIADWKGLKTRGSDRLRCEEFALCESYSPFG